MTRRGRDERGAAMLIALMGGALLALLASWIITSARRIQSAAVRGTAEAQARAIAEGGLDMACAELTRLGGKYGGSRERMALGKGGFSLTVRGVPSRPAERLVVAQGESALLRGAGRVCVIKALAVEDGSTWKIARWLNEQHR